MGESFENSSTSYSSSILGFFIKRADLRFPDENSLSLPSLPVSLITLGG
jgi:hypothetical protein